VDNQTQVSADSHCLLAVANALIVDGRLIAFLADLASQWGSSTGKTRSYHGLVKEMDADRRCILRIDSRTAILLNEALYRPEGPSPVAAQLAEALRHPDLDASGRCCRIAIARLSDFTICIDQYIDSDGLPVEPDSPRLHHRVVSIRPA